MHGQAITVLTALVAALVGAGAGFAIRAAVFHHTVAAGTPWRTECPSCGTPVVRDGWGLLASGLSPSGRCPSCAHRIGPPPGSVELVTAAAAGVLVWRAGLGLTALALAAVAVVGVALAFVDIAVHRLPDRLVLTAIIAALAVFALDTALGAPPQRLLTATACALGAGLAFFLIVFASPDGMGLGDAKLAVLVGLVTGWFGVLTAVYAIFVGFLLAGAAVAVMLVARRITRKDRLAMGPFMLLGALAAILLPHV